MSQVIDKKLSAAIDKLNDKQKQEVLVFVSHIQEEGEQGYDKWKDDSFEAEMERRRDNYLNGGKMITAAESAERIKRLFEKNKRK